MGRTADLAYRLPGLDRGGTLVTGGPADVVAVDDRLDVIETVIGGRTAFRR